MGVTPGSSRLRRRGADRRRGDARRGRRGRHVVHAVAVRDGRVELAAGDPALVTFLRSSAKPIQALPVVRARPDLDDEQIALLCASHLAAPEQLAIVAASSPTRRRRRTSSSAGRRRRALEHNCSGKHAGFLALCRARGLGHARLPAARASLPAGDAAARSRRRPRSRRRRSSRESTAAACRRSRCRSSGRRTPSPGSRRSTAATRVVRGDARPPGAAPWPGRRRRGPDRALDGWVAKGGAEGLFCAASPDGLGHRAQGRGRRVPRDPAGAAHVLLAARARRPALAASATSRTATASMSASCASRRDDRVR